jgi:hypothetical protein
MCLIPFSAKIEELKIDKELPSKLFAELPGIPHGATGHIVGPNHLTSSWQIVSCPVKSLTREKAGADFH